MNFNNANFITSALTPEQYPDSPLPEIAFAGRSNSGKSSLINCLLNRRNFAKAGKMPGKTRLINFYNIDNTLCFVDLPGYGYAKVSKSEKKSWGQVIEAYLNGREQLKFIIMLVDIRHKPTEDDKLMYEWICFKSLPYLIVAAKADKIAKSKLNENINIIKNELGCPSHIQVIPFSSVTRQGREEVLGKISEII